MKIEMFLRKNNLQKLEGNSLVESSKLSESTIEDKVLKDFLIKYGGHQIDNGLFNIHTLTSSYFWTEASTDYFSAYKNSIYCFGYDWAGRQFGISANKENCILMLDPATGDAYELFETFEDFLNVDLVTYRSATLNEKKFIKLKKKFKRGLVFNECIGFIKPLFLGGIDVSSNCEIVDMAVYWDLNYQLFSKIKDIPDGTNISEINF